MRQCPPTLLAIVVYKVLSATLFVSTAIAPIFTVKHYDALEAWANAMTLAHRHGVVAWSVENIAQIQPRTLEYSAAIAVIYAGLSTA
jgi:Predicted membrane protein (DUF2127)